MYYVLCKPHLASSNRTCIYARYSVCLVVVIAVVVLIIPNDFISSNLRFPTLASQPRTTSLMPSNIVTCRTAPPQSEGYTSRYPSGTVRTPVSCLPPPPPPPHPRVCPPLRSPARDNKTTLPQSSHTQRERRSRNSEWGQGHHTTHRLVGWTRCKAHLPDVGARFPLPLALVIGPSARLEMIQLLAIRKPLRAFQNKDKSQ